MELEEKIRRIEDIVKLNHSYIRQIGKVVRMLCREVDLNVGDIQKITNGLAEHLGVDLETGVLKKIPVNIEHKKELRRMFL